MRVIDRLKNYFINEDYFISIYKEHIYLINYIDILDFNENKIKVKFKKLIIVINGLDFKIIRKSDTEIEIKGVISKLEIINE